MPYEATLPPVQSAGTDQTAVAENLAHIAQLALLQQAAETGGSIKIAFRDRCTGILYVGEISPTDRTHDLHEISASARVNHWLRQYGRPALSVIPTYDFRFEPDTGLVFDGDRQPPFINRYVASVNRRTRTAVWAAERQGTSTVAATDGDTQ